MNTALRNAATSLVFSFTLVGGVHAYLFSIDSFQVYKGPTNSNPIYIDNFSDGSPPPTATNEGGGGDMSYFMSGTMGPESVGPNGRLQLNQSGAVFSNGLLGDSPTLAQTARLNTSASSDPTNITGLKLSTNFTVIGRFDLIAPALGEFYGIRLDDRTGGLGNDIVDLRLRNDNGTPSVIFRITDQVGATRDTYQLPLALVYDQIELAFDYFANSPGVVHGKFRYVDSIDCTVSSPCGWQEFSNTVSIFDGEIFTRAAFLAGTNVPEPASIALLGIGLAGLGFSRRKRAN